MVLVQSSLPALSPSQRQMGISSCPSHAHAEAAVGRHKMAATPEANEFSQETKVAMCVACTLATSMQSCDACPFKIGRAVREMVHMTLDPKADPLEVATVFSETQAKFPRIYAAYRQYVTT
jgi:hypothetical protein